MSKSLGSSDANPVTELVKDVVIYGDTDNFKLLCKASSEKEGWMKSTKVCNVPSGCVIQVTTQQRNEDGSYSVAEALTFVPNTNITDNETRRLIPIK